MLEQDSLSIARGEIKKGDIVYIAPLRNMALLIAPTLNDYIAIKKKLKNFSLIHPDLFASKLYNNNSPIPTKDDFKQFCKETL